MLVLANHASSYAFARLWRSLLLFQGWNFSEHSLILFIYAFICFFFAEPESKGCGLGGFKMLLTPLTKWIAVWIAELWAFHPSAQYYWKFPKGKMQPSSPISSVMTIAYCRNVLCNLLHIVGCIACVGQSSVPSHAHPIFPGIMGWVFFRIGRI